VLHKIALMCAIATGLSGADFEWNIPKGFPRPVVPADNPMSAAKVELGGYLFYDKRLSANGKTACATCHRQDLAFTDGQAQAKGTTGELHPRSSMSLVNVAYATSLTWANPALDSLEEQALVPILGENPIELGLKGHEPVFVSALQKEPVYQRLFPRVFADGIEKGRDVYTLKNAVKAIAAFERTIISMRSPYDRYRWEGESSAISDSAKRGELLFSSSEKAGCFQCHGGWNFTAVRVEGHSAGGGMSHAFFNTGVSKYEAPNRGVYEQTQRAEDVGKFRPPTLRNIAITAPYMHDGSLATLEDVIDHYAAGGKFDHANKTRILRKFALTASEKADLIEFLKSLTDEKLLHDPRWSDPWSVGEAPLSQPKADEGVGRGPGGPPHNLLAAGAPAKQ
jgi:cytochrome c peroxidase